MTETPSILWGSLFTTVQQRVLFPDSKTFADAIPRRDVAAILDAWERSPVRDDAALREFVAANFILPHAAETGSVDKRPIVEHIAALWPVLTREPGKAVPGNSLLSLPRRYVVPGGRFRELYYWDSYFTMLGLARSGAQDLIEDMIADFGSLIDRYGHIPNGTRSYYLSRSHPPVFYLMAALSADDSVAARRQRLAWMQAEHAFWMAGAGSLTEPGEHRRVVRLDDGAILNRYWDDIAAPRDESWREDMELAAATPDRVDTELWRDLRAAAESGWDFSSRWLGDGRSLATIRTTRLLPIDLNALLHGLEDTIANEAATLADAAMAEHYASQADARRAAINKHLWNDAQGFYADFDLDRAAVGDRLTAALGFASFCGITTPDRHARVAGAIKQLLRPGGLMTTLLETGQQWDSPNGWAPLQWIAIAGLYAQGDAVLAEQIADRWLATVTDCYDATGRLLEKYDVEHGGGGGGGEYGLEIGFGWTNGVTLALLELARQSVTPAPMKT